MNTNHTPSHSDNKNSLDPTVTAVHDPVPSEASHTVFTPPAPAAPSRSGWRPRAMLVGGLAAALAFAGIIGLAVTGGSASDEEPESQVAISDEGVNEAVDTADAERTPDAPAAPVAPAASEAPAAPAADTASETAPAEEATTEEAAPEEAAADEPAAEDAVEDAATDEASAEEATDEEALAEEATDEEAPADDESDSWTFPDFDRLEDFTPPDSLDFGFLQTFVAMPDVIGMEWTSAQSMLTDLGLEVAVVFHLTPFGDDDAVTEASHDTGDFLTRGSAVTLWVDQVVDLSPGI